VGSLLGDSVRHLIAGTVITVLGVILGYRPGAGVGGVVTALGLVVVFAFGLSWVFTTLGLLLRSPNAVMNAGFMGIFPLTFLSNVFVDPDTLPAGVEAFVDVNPISIPGDRFARVDGGECQGERHRHRACGRRGTHRGLCATDDASVPQGPSGSTICDHAGYSTLDAGCF